jgi:predicted MFS family arabinose efflux permease
MSPGPQPAAPRAPLHFLGLACAVSVSSLYFNQPLLAEMAQSFHATAAQVGLVAVATQVGYAAGLLFFVPLGDVLERRRLMLRMYAAVALALLVVALAPTLSCVIAASVLLGMVASVTHVVLPIAPDLVAEKVRGRAIGTVMMGLLLGILLARTFAGWVSRVPGWVLRTRGIVPTHAWVADGWRYVFFIAAIVSAFFVPLIRRVMPELKPTQDLGYREAMESLWTLFRTQPLLRESSLIGALVFASFSCFWTTLAFFLSSHYGLGAGVAGSFGLIGAAGALVAPLAGRLSDRRGVRWVLTAGISTLAFSYVLLWAGERSHIPFVAHIAILVIGVIVLDIGAQLTQVANQTRIFGLVPSARSRLNTVYMTVYFAGAAIGSAVSAAMWARYQWNGVCAMALGFIALAGLRLALGTRERTITAEPLSAEALAEHAAIETVLEA